MSDKNELVIDFERKGNKSGEWLLKSRSKPWNNTLSSTS